MKIAIYAGTFDPITKGHLSVLSRAASLFDQVIVAVAADNNKNTLFTLQERQALAKSAVRQLPNVEVEAFTGLLVEYAKEKGASALIRGLRMVSDFEYEMQMATFNKDLCHTLETVFFIADAELSYVSSSQVRSIASLGGNIDRYVTEEVAAALYQKFRK